LFFKSITILLINNAMLRLLNKKLSDVAKHINFMKINQNNGRLLEITIKVILLKVIFSLILITKKNKLSKLNLNNLLLILIFIT